MRFQLAPAAAALLFVLAAPAAAIDDRFDPQAHAKGDFAPANDPAYQKECGSCHFAYLPGMLPARSWQAIMAGANDHFGESLSLQPEEARRLQDYLVANAADRSDYRGSELMLGRLSASATPLRITSLPLFKSRHFTVVYLRGAVSSLNSVRDLPPAGVKVVMNCNECHEKAATGSFAEREIVVPRVTKVVRPGGLF